MEQSREETGRLRRAYRRPLAYLIGISLVIAVWDIIHLSTGSDTFPEFFAVVADMFGLFSAREVWVGLGYSLYRIVIMLVITTVLGSLLGLAAAYFEAVEIILRPIIYLITAFPTASMIFVLIIYTKITSYLLVGFLTFPIFYKAALGGGKIILSRYSDPMRLDGNRSLHNFCSVLIPLSLPYVFMGLAQSSGLALKAEIMSEVFVSDYRYKGIGVLIRSAYNSVDMLRLFSLTLLAILFMSLVEAVIHFVKAGLTRRYGIEPVRAFRLF